MHTLKIMPNFMVFHFDKIILMLFSSRCRFDAISIMRQKLIDLCAFTLITAFVYATNYMPNFKLFWSMRS